MKPLLILPLADMHTGSIYGIHPYYIKRNGEWITVDEAGGWYYKNNPHYYLNTKQVRMWRHFEKGIKALAELRKSADYDLLIAVMGDAIDGDHHNTFQLTTKNEAEQMLAHIEIMQWVKEQFDFQTGRDKLVYIEGTESHTRDNEEAIGQHLNAEKFPGGASCTSFLEMEVQDNLIWLYHHGVAAGYSWASGQTHFNYLKSIYVDRRMNQKRPPNLVMTADKHTYSRQAYIHNGHELHGIVLPPLQEKTRFTNKIPRAIVTETKTGIAPLIISNGRITPLAPHLLEYELGDVLTW